MKKSTPIYVLALATFTCLAQENPDHYFGTYPFAPNPEGSGPHR